MSELALQLIEENKKTKSPTLDLGNCDLNEVPEAIGELVWLEELILSDKWYEYYIEKKQSTQKNSQNKGGANKIETLPLTLPFLILLKKLIFSNSEVIDLSPIGALANLQLLDCSSTKISDLTPIAGLAKLQQLNCRNTQISDLTPIAGLTNLLLLYCYVTKISDLTPIAGLTLLQQLDCSSTQISDLTPIASLANLQQLNCRNTQISNLNPIAALANLQQLYCYSTRISDLTPVAGLTKMQLLSCHSTKISDLSPIAGLANLQQLGCNSTLISDLSPIAGLTNLQQLDCQNTHIIDLSPIAGLTNLKQLDCRNTQINDLSPIAGLTNLQQLDCRNTPISDLSKIGWGNFQNLRRLDVSKSKVENISSLKPMIQKGLRVKWNYQEDGICILDCPLTHPPVEIVKQGNAAILQYFEEIERARQTDSVIRLAEAKCLILGEGGAGKTSLTRKLLNPKNPLPEEKETTKGIAVHPHDLSLADGTEFRLNIWDFGGQEIYHATHQFFLTKRSLYILLDDTRKDEKTVHDPIFNYWLQVAELYGSGSPLLIVQNEKGDRSKELDLRSMQSRFGFVKDAKATNLLTCRDLDKVWEAIAYWLKQLPHIGEEQPKAWLDIRRELEQLTLEQGRDHISLETYYSICAKHSIPESKRALFLSGYLHDFGAFLHFQDHPVLRKTLILNNQWATDAVYKVLDCETIKKAFGRFTSQDLSEIWAEDRYAEQHAELLALMEKFELCYKLPDEKIETWLAPQLLSVKQPESLDWDESGNLQVRYEYEFMPKGLLSQHIVRMHRYVRQPDLAWKSGVIFERAGSHALVTEAWGSRKISLRAKGPQAKELLTLLSEDFDKMHDRLEGLRVKKMIPCNCNVCGKVTEPHFYEYDDLARRKELGKPTVECKVSFEDVSVPSLLDGVKAQKIIEQPEDKKTEQKTIKIFLASSYELQSEREKIELEINRMNKDLRHQGIFLELLIWEDGKHIGKSFRSQDNYNLELDTCDVFFLLFYSKVGKFTKEEFERAKARFDASNAPRMVLFRKNTALPNNISTADFTSREDFLEHLKDIDHYPTEFGNTDALIKMIGDCIDNLIADDDFMGQLTEG